MTIIRYGHCDDIDVEFENGSIVENNRYGNFIRGSIRNYFAKTLFNIGYIGYGDHKYSINSKLTSAGEIWRGIMRRCYSENDGDRFPTYYNIITVCEEWHNFQNFAKWYDENYIAGFHLDKDIICKDCKIYSPETCAFVPREINNLFIQKSKDRKNGVSKRYNGKYLAQAKQFSGKSYVGVFDTEKEAAKAYKRAKELTIKEIAEKWKDKIDPRVYEAMMNYEVKITD